MRPKVITRCVASRYQLKNERIIEFSFPGTAKRQQMGGLISLRLIDDKPIIELYRVDYPVKVIVSKEKP